MARDEKRRDPGEFYPGGKVWVKPGQSQPQLEGAVQYDREQTLTDEQKKQAQKNIGTFGKLPLRPLPKYLHALSFDETYPADAAWLYSQLGPSDLGRCSAVRRGGKLWRNYDWTFDSSAEFAVKVSGNASRFASVGMASVGARLTENDVASGVYSRYYRCLPGMTLDGINEKGVVCEINVDGGPKDGWHGAGANALHILAAVRWALDHGETAAQAAAWLADHIIQPTGEMNFHFMVADAEKTYIVENGAAYDMAHGTKVLTNYALFDSANTGGGKERYTLLAGGADIKSVWFTNAYQSGNDWDSDFDSAAQHAAAIEQWAEQGTDKEAHRGKTTSGGKAWWQSVHTTEYDFAAKTMKVAVQETDEWFTFAVDAQGVTEVSWEDVKDKPSTFPPSAHTHLQSQVEGLSDALAAKRGMTDRDFSTDWVCTPALPTGITIKKATPSTMGYWAPTDENGTVVGLPQGTQSSMELHWTEYDFSFGYAFTATRTFDTLALSSEVPALAAPSESATDTQAAKAKSTYDFVNSSINAMAAFYITKNAAGDSFATKAELTAAISSGTFYNGGQPRTPTKNDYLYVLADESATQIIPGVNPTTRYSFDGAQWAFQIVVNNTALTSAQVAAINSGINAALVSWLATFKGTERATTLASVLAAINGKLNLTGGVLDEGAMDFEASAGDVVLRSANTELRVSDADGVSINGELVAKISDILARIAPAFAAKTGTGAYAEGAMVTSGGSLYKRNATAGADTSWIAAHWDALADLSGVLSGLKSDGTATDQFATDLLEKPVAKTAIAYSLKTGTDAMTDRAVKTYDGTSAQVDVTFPTNIPVGITDFEAWIKMGATVQTVTYPDDDYTIEWKDGKVPTSSDYTANATNIVHFTIVKESETATPIVTAILAGFMAATPAA